MQTDYDYEIAKQERERQKMEQKQEFEVVSDIEDETPKTFPNDESDETAVKKEDPSDAVASLPEWQKETEVSKKSQNESTVLQENHEDSEKQHHKEMQKIFLNF